MHFDQLIPKLFCGIYASVTAPSTSNSQTKWNISVLGQSSPNPWGDFGPACKYKCYSV